MSVASHDKLAAWFVGWWLADWLVIRLIGWLTGGLAHGLVSRMADHPNDGLHTDWTVSRFSGQPS